jgi:hypothetical protein
MTDVQQQPNDQFDDIDPLELVDQETPDEEVGELAHIEDEDHPAIEHKIVEEEQDLAKVIDAVTLDVAPGITEEIDTIGANHGVAIASNDKNGKRGEVKKGSTSHLISKDLIERELTAEDLWDEGSL